MPRWWLLLSFLSSFFAIFPLFSVFGGSVGGWISAAKCKQTSVFFIVHGCAWTAFCCWCFSCCQLAIHFVASNAVTVWFFTLSFGDVLLLLIGRRCKQQIPRLHPHIDTFKLTENCLKKTLKRQWYRKRRWCCPFYHKLTHTQRRLVSFQCEKVMTI